MSVTEGHRLYILLQVTVFWILMRVLQREITTSAARYKDRWYITVLSRLWESVRSCLSCEVRKDDCPLSFPSSLWQVSKLSLKHLYPRMSYCHSLSAATSSPASFLLLCPLAPPRTSFTLPLVQLLSRTQWLVLLLISASPCLLLFSCVTSRLGHAPLLPTP